MLGFAKKLFGSSNDRKVKTLQARVAKINALEPQMAALTDDALRAKTDEFRARLDKGETLDALLPEAFAAVREASKRAIGLRHFDVQMVGGMVLHEGGISEMRTGEGKTLVATLATYLNALPGKGVHVITVNDYLASRDAEWMGRIYKFLGLSTGVIVNGLSQGQRKAAYNSDITYGTNNEFGFDYLRDNLVYDKEEMVQRGHNFVIVDEVDSILIDEARTPLIISGPTEDRSEFYRTVDVIVKELIQDKSTYDFDEKQRQVLLTEEGSEKVEEMLIAGGHLDPESAGLYDAANVSAVHHVNQALRANVLYTLDKDYIVKNGEVILIDEFTGRMMSGRRLSEGLHQAIEAKEGVEVQPENQTLASVTIQNYFRLYNKLSGMTGTAATEAQEFADIYKMGVSEIPTNRVIKRIDIDDEVYRTEAEKNVAILQQVADCYVRGQPILVGTASIEKSEQLSELMNAYVYGVDLSNPDEPKLVLEKDLADSGVQRLTGIPHNVLNARYHEQEAVIVADAGVPGAVTIATNMAGRGTDIQLGGNVDMRLAKWREEQAGLGIEPTAEAEAAQRAAIEEQIADAKAKALAAGGLYVLGTERHESRRIDNQLRGRSGRQGDPGSSRFYLSLEDDLMRLFGSDRIKGLMEKLGLRDGEAIENAMVTRAVEGAQKRVEAHHFEIRKTLLDYDNVMNQQREVIYTLRRELMVEEDLEPVLQEFMSDVLDDVYSPLESLPVDGQDEARAAALVRLRDVFNLDRVLEEGARLPEREETEVMAQGILDKLKAETGPTYADILRYFLLEELDRCWKEHLRNMDALRDGIGLRGYGQRDPKLEYKREGFEMFQAMLFQIRESVFRALTRIRVQIEPIPAEPEQQEVEVPAEEPQHSPVSREYRHKESSSQLSYSSGGSISEDPKKPAKAAPRIGRNDLCPCGSGKKYKKCCGQDK